MALPTGAVLEKGATLEVGAEVQTMKRLQGWSRFLAPLFLGNLENQPIQVCQLFLSLP